MILSIVVAMSRNRVIGRDNQLPWHLPADLKHFKALTMGKPIIMGRKTYESIGRPLPGRTNIVLTRDTAYQQAGCVIVHDIDAALTAAGDVEEVMIVGGAELYRQLLSRVYRIYLTQVEIEVEGDAYFPELDPRQWREVACERFSADERNPHDYGFYTYERLK